MTFSEKAGIWIGAARPKILPASMVPAVLGSAVAYHEGYFQLLPAAVALLCAMLLQTISNLYNDVYDFKRGADTADRVGPKRYVASGLISPSLMMKVTGTLAFFTFVLGLYLVSVGGLPILIIGLLSLFFAWAYTGGPYPLAYLGLGDVFVLLFFGLIPTLGTYYIQAQELSDLAWAIAVVPGLLAANILAVNNIRDIVSDKPAGKITLAVRLGDRNSRLLFCVVAVAAFAIPAYLAVSRDGWFWLPMLALPIQIQLCKKVLKDTGALLNESLALSAKLLAIVGLLLTISLVVSTAV